VTPALIYFIIGIFIVSGIVQLSELFIKWSFIPINHFNKEKIFLLPIYKHQENIEYIIRSIIFTYTTQLSNCKFRIICVDLGSDTETKKICSILSRDYSCVHIVNL